MRLLGLKVRNYEAKQREDVNRFWTKLNWSQHCRHRLIPLNEGVVNVVFHRAVYPVIILVAVEQQKQPFDGQVHLFNWWRVLLVVSQIHLIVNVDLWLVCIKQRFTGLNVAWGFQDHLLVVNFVYLNVVKPHEVITVLFPNDNVMDYIVINVVR